MNAKTLIIYSVLGKLKTFFLTYQKKKVKTIKKGFLSYGT